jgi:hypothetical protein
MKMTANIALFLILTVAFSACEKEELAFTTGDIQVQINTGDHWLHDFPLFLGLTKKNPPQFAIWLEDTSGNYLSTVFVTHKIAVEGWQANKGNRRKESLPYWCHQRGIVYEDGLLLPTKEQPLTDAITGATPKEDKTIRITPVNLEKPFVIKAEFNHSVDFNDFFPESAKEGDDNYTGGAQGSGQPAVIYAATVYPDTKHTVLEPIGYSSPDGSTGHIYLDLEKLTTAKSIVKSIHLTIK